MEEALAYIQVTNLFLHFDDMNGCDLWTVGRKVPTRVRRSLYEHKEEILILMHEGDSRTCPARELHRPYWYYRHGQFVCEVCQRFTRSGIC